MILKIVYRAKTTYNYHPDVSTSVNEKTRVISMGSCDYKISPICSAYVLNASGATIHILKVKK